MKKNNLTVIVLAAGEGKRMKSSLPKVCHKLAGKNLLSHVLSTSEGLDPKQVFVVNGHQAETVVKSHEKERIIKWIKQDKQLGTGHAVAQILPELKEETRMLILFGDVPLISLATLQTLIEKTPHDDIGIITGNLDNPFGLGRIIRDQENQVLQIVEERDASIQQKKIREVFSGIMVLPSRLFVKWWPKLTNNNAQKEFYLTEIIAHAILDKFVITSVLAPTPEEILGVNTREQLQNLERLYQRKVARKLMKDGVSLRDANRLDVRGDVNIASDVEIDINVILEGNVTIGKKTKIGANVVIKDSNIGENVLINPNTVIDGANVSNDCIIGPFARIRPGVSLKEKVKIGNFVELKKASVDEGSKISHLSYVGDSVVGKEVNIGAGTITCNYDGANKHTTVIEDGAFIGSNTQLVAPVKVGKNSTIGAGTTVTKDTPPDVLVLSRVEQKTVLGWKRPKKKK